MPFSPLGRGFLTGTAQRAESYPSSDIRHRDPRLQGANFDANMRMADAVRQIAGQKSVTPGQIALAWLLHQGPDVVPIPGTKRRRYLEENVGAAAIALSAAELAALDQALPRDGVSGPRYNAEMMALVDR